MGNPAVSQWQSQTPPDGILHGYDPDGLFRALLCIGQGASGGVQVFPQAQPHVVRVLAADDQAEAHAGFLPMVVTAWAARRLGQDREGQGAARWAVGLRDDVGPGGIAAKQARKPAVTEFHKVHTEFHKEVYIGASRRSLETYQVMARIIKVFFFM